ncbi:peptidoglycan DD-metalloendopeptidase family protein [Curtobacterium sp. VKM Ac-2865]|uniref:M23 family metallopeptidase n=1 Tax=Curtobacterium sp. VKM Ac-2865 TaxID=2783817 RepID=UPI00188D7F23|nr:M23 family metallopeptidase [Curtobacterium sp. VKM Ac-2865]MBF4582608.1 peptidoglycan DD-metalloendopeptidase family protein [Curtobacterium sp. VKM Ac-2865]
MPQTPLSPVVSGRTTTDATAQSPHPTPVTHLTRRARIEAERAAVKQGVQRMSSSDTAVVPAPVAAAPSSAAPVSPVADDSAAAMPVTPPAPASPVLPQSAFGPVTPPAPSSPVVAPTTKRAGSRRRTVQSASTAKSAVPAAKAAPAAVRVDRATRHLGAVPRPAATTQRGGVAFRRNASRVTAVGALLFAAGLVVSTSLPAQALYTAEPGSPLAAAAAAGDAQDFRSGDTTTGSIDRDAYTVTAAAAQPKVTDSSSFTNDPAGTIQWPFPTGVPITSGFGGRQVAGCSFCSTNHQGVDFAPGAGTPIHVIAAGTVVKVQAHDGGFGNDVWVEHEVDGKQFTSVYGHMQDDSFQVMQGQEVEVGDVLGLVGSTGNSTGPHLHLEVHLDGVPVDPLAWLRANAN